MVHTPAAIRWAAIIEEQEASGKTIRAFAAERDLNPSTLAWWRSRLGRARRRKKAADVAPTFNEVQVKPAAKEPATADGTVVVALENLDAHVIVDHDTDLELLRKVLDALC